MSQVIRTLLVVSFLCFYSPISHAQDGAKSKFLDIQEVTSKGGIKAWLVEDHSLPIITMGYSFRGAGAKNEPANKQGLAQLASNTMDEGAGDIKSQEFQKALKDNSITLTFNAGRDHFGGALKTLTQNKDKAFDLLTLALTKPRFDLEPVKRMCSSNQSRLKTSLSNPNWLAARIKNDRIYEGHAYAMNSGGTLSSLESITPDDLRGFHKTLGKNQLVISVAGDISAAELQQTLDDVFGSMPVVETPEPIKTPTTNGGEIYLYKQNIPQTIIEITQPGVSRQDKDFYSAYLMNFILGQSGFGSRLMEEIREKRGLTYGVYSYFRQYEEADTLHVSTSTANKNVAEMLSLIHKEWNKMKEAPVTSKELSEAKSYLIGSLPLSLTSTGSIAGVMLSLQLDNLPIDYLDKRANEINAVEADDIHDIAKRILNTGKMTTIMVGNPESFIDNDINIVSELPNVE